MWSLLVNFELGCGDPSSFRRDQQHPASLSLSPNVSLCQIKRNTADLHQQRNNESLEACVNYNASGLCCNYFNFLPFTKTKRELADSWRLPFWDWARNCRVPDLTKYHAITVRGSGAFSTLGIYILSSKDGTLNTPKRMRLSMRLSSW